MNESTIDATVRTLGDGVNAIDIRGDVNAAAEKALTAAFTKASDGARAVILNFERMAYMNSTGIGLLVTLLVRANRQKQTLMATGLNDHYQRIFDLTRLNEAIRLFATEEAALAALATG
jgi:anti-sigma B factor antagonist